MTIVSKAPDAHIRGSDESRGDSRSWANALAASRRVDWRFLMPTPQLGRVAYLGPEDSSLYIALCQFGDAVTRVTRPDVDAARADTFDVVVSAAEAAAIRQTVPLVRPGGFLYVEWDRRHVSRASERPESIASGLGKLGFSKVSLHWHWPTFDSCQEMVRLDDRTALLHVMARRGSGLLARCKAQAARGLIRCGQFSRVVRCVSLLAERDDTSGPSSHSLHGAACDV